MPVIDAIDADIIEVPLRHAFATAQDRMDRQVSRVVVIRVRLDDGRIAHGEAVPVQYVTGETHEGVLAAVAAAAPALAGADPSRWRSAVGSVHRVLPPSACTARAGLGLALADAWSMVTGVPLWHALGAAATEVTTDITLALGPEAAQRARDAAGRGFRALKMKVGGADVDAEVERVAEVQRAAPDCVLRLDANQAYEPDSALQLIRGALRAGVRLELVEQPVRSGDLDALDRVASASPVPVIADEAVKTPADALRVVTQTRTHGVNVKVMKSGLCGALEIIAIARAAGRKLMVGCMLETRRGIAASLALACGTGAFDYVDLDSHLLLREEGPNPHFAEAGPRLHAPGRRVGDHAP